MGKKVLVGGVTQAGFPQQEQKHGSDGAAQAGGNQSEKAQRDDGKSDASGGDAPKGGGKAVGFGDKPNALAGKS